MTKVIMTKDRQFVQVIEATTIPFVAPGMPFEFEQAIRAMDDMIASVRLSMLIPESTIEQSLDFVSPETETWIKDLLDDQAHAD
jgi:hypothetical protein